MAITSIQRVQTKVVRDSSALTENEVTVDFLNTLKETLRELKKSKLNPSTPELYLGLLGEFGFAKWLKERNFIFDHRTSSNPNELSMDFVVFGSREDSRSIRVDVKTSGIRPPKVSRIISVDQFESIPEHSDILVWAFYSSWRNTITIDAWTHVSSLREAKLKLISAPPDISTTNDPAVDLDFTDSMHVYEIPNYLMLNIEDLEMKLKGFSGGF